MLAVAFVALLAWSWRKWTDPHIDFGNELYIAWRLTEGEALYRDIAHRNGPLSHYVNALWFALFGVSLRTLVFCNLAVLAGICAALYRGFERFAGAFVATACGLVLLGVFAFSQYSGIANFNFVTPYHHFQTHGIALALAQLAALERLARSGRPAWAAAAGLALGAAFLTKVELFVPALAMAAAAAAGLAVGGAPRAQGRVARVGLVFVGAALVPPLVCFLALALQMPAGTALQGTLGNWAYLAGALADRYYLAGAGLADWRRNGALALAGFAGIALFGVALAGLDRLAPKAPTARRALAALAGAGLFALLAWRPHAVGWATVLRALPLTSAALAVALGVACWRARADAAAFGRLFPAALFAVWALALLAKLGLAARVQHYGFALAMPATLLLVAALLHGLPAWLRRHGGGGEIARALAAAGVAGAVLFYWQWSDRLYAHKTLEIVGGADGLLVDDPAVNPRGQILGQAVERLRTLMQPGETLLVLPEGISLNYWLRRDNPTPYDLFLPTEIAAFGEDAMLRALRARPPDFVVLAHRLHREFGVGPFGVDPRNGRRLMEFVTRRYERVARLGAEPFTGGGFGLVILRRR